MLVLCLVYLSFILFLFILHVVELKQTALFTELQRYDHLFARYRMNGLLKINLDVYVLANEPLALDFLTTFIEIMFHVVTLCRIALKDNALCV